MFGRPVTVLDDTYALIGDGGDGSGGPIGGIGQAGTGSPYTGHFRVDDVDAALERAERAGGARRLDPISLPGRGRMAVFTDPDGNPVGLLGD